MNKKKSIFDWLDYKNEDEVEWATNYLNKKGLIDWSTIHSDETTDAVLSNTINWIKAWNVQAEAINLNILMKAAKYQRRNRQAKNKDNQKNYSFVMDKSIQGKLKNIAGEQPLSQTLEHIINDVAQFKKQLETELRESIKPAKIRSSSLSNEEKSKRKIAQLEIIKTAQEQILKQLLLEICQKEYVIEKTSEQLILLEADRAHISEKYKNRQKDINQSIKEQLGLFKFVAVNMDTNIIGDEEKENLKNS